MSADHLDHQVRRTLATVADLHRPDPEAWDHIQARLDADEPAPAPSPLAARRRPLRLLAAAAVVLAVVAVGLAVLAQQGGDEDGRVTSEPGAEPATGWYVPRGLPAGWTLLTVEQDRLDLACPCRTVVWRDEPGERWITASYEDDPGGGSAIHGTPGDHVSTFALSDDLDAELNAPDGSAYWDVSWSEAGRRTSIVALGIEPALAAGIARILHDDPGLETAPVPGLHRSGGWSEPGAVGHDAQVTVRYQAPSGDILWYTLEAPRAAITMEHRYAPTELLAGRQPLPVLRSRPLRGSSVQTEDLLDLLGRWPGATVRAPGGYQTVDGVRTPTDEEVLTLVASLRPATTEQWRAFVAGAANRDRAVTAAATLQELVDDRASGAPLPTGSDSSLEGLELTVTAEPRVAATEDLGVVLHVRNPTDRTIADPTCALDHASVGLLLGDTPTQAQLEAAALEDPDGVWQDDGPCDGGLVLAPGAAKAIRLVVRAERVNPAGAALVPGSYRATVMVEGLEARPSAPVQIG